MTELIDSRTDPLGEVREIPHENEFPNKCWFELTLNYPRTPRFLNSTTTKQKRMYFEIYNEILCTFNRTRILSHKYCFEQCKNGHIHLHALIWMKCRKEYYPNGMVRDIVVTALDAVPKKYKAYKDANLNPEWHRYKDPYICLQYRTPEEEDRLLTWSAYINKNSHIDI